MLFPTTLQKLTIQGQCIELVVPDGNAVKEAYQEGLIPFPYWSRVWPAAKALAAFLLHNNHYTAGKNVMELGAGLGLPSIVAARNAVSVLCSDYVLEAVEIAKQSATHHQLQNFRAEVLNWQELPSDLEADVLLLSDINYEPSAFAFQLEMIKSFLQNGTVVLLSTPQRLMAKDFVAPLLEYCTWQEELAVVHEEKEVTTTVLVLKQ